MYKVKYAHPMPAEYVVRDTNNEKPPFGWIPFDRLNNSVVESTWSYHAKTVFDIESVQGLQESIDGKLSLLKNLGCTDDDLNLKTLKENDYNTERCIRLLLQRNIDNALKARQDAIQAFAENLDSGSEGSSYHSSTDDDEPKERQPTAKRTPSRKRQPKLLPTEPQDDDCSICCSNYAITSENWKSLQCQHKLCVNCYKKIEITRTTMTGVSHTFIKCPFCLATFGIEIGLCPNGEMSETILLSPCAGYEGSNTISIIYTVRTPLYRMKRNAFLPDNVDGRKILKLLRIAWDRRLSITIGTSHTTGIENTLVWNIHHKTSQSGGVYRYGFPDLSYFDRVIAELKSFGIQ